MKIVIGRNDTRQKGPGREEIERRTPSINRLLRAFGLGSRQSPSMGRKGAISWRSDGSEGLKARETKSRHRDQHKRQGSVSGRRVGLVRRLIRAPELTRGGMDKRE
jgi:hypothetical protein